MFDTENSIVSDLFVVWLGQLIGTELTGQALGLLSNKLWFLPVRNWPSSGGGTATTVKGTPVLEPYSPAAHLSPTTYRRVMSNQLSDLPVPQFCHLELGIIIVLISKDCQ